MHITRVLLLIVILLVVGGCYQTYTGIYFVRQAEHASSNSFEDIELQLTNVLKPLGFRNRKMPLGINHYFVLVNNQKDALPEYANLFGANAKIKIAVGYDDLIITIRDLDNTTETEFVRTVKEVIKQLFENRYGVRGIKFKRQNDLLF